MINNITIKGVASYKSEACLRTDKNVNLIYGLNGSGKSTISEFLRNRNSEIYKGCFVEPDINDLELEILVYNENYVNDVFYSSETQKGIFSLSKENAEARKKIDSANLIIVREGEKLEIKGKEKREEKEGLDRITSSFSETIWEIKKEYASGDRALEYCFSGLKKSKEQFLDYFMKLPEPEREPYYTIEELEEEAQMLNSARDKEMSPISEISFPANSIEKDPIFKEVITGNPNSKVAKLIDELHNSNWIKTGLSFKANKVCPFCQRPYDDSNILQELKDYFNDDYERSIHIISTLKLSYESLKNDISIDITIFNDFKPISYLVDSLNSALKNLKEIASKNYSLIQNKLSNPSQIIELVDSSALLMEANEIVKKANSIITDFNGKVKKIDDELAVIKSKFWNRQRYNYVQSVKNYLSQKIEREKKMSNSEAAIKSIQESIVVQKGIIEKEQQNIVNIEESIEHINTMLTDMGITDFKITKSLEEGLYRIARGTDDGPIFKTLSEGERTIISVLYFVETCKGIIEKNQTKKQRIIIIDDPVSSLSNIYVFNIARLLRNVFYPELVKDSGGESLYKVNPKFEQVFILTHSLYFFYEMTEIDKNKRHASQALFRVSKTDAGSKIEPMYYEHIQNDYHAYWMAIKDKNTNPALIANCMRNIIEYFFNFVEKRDLNNVFQLGRFKQPKYQAFQRYINRESHSLGQNIFDFKEFDYAIFMDALKMVFVESGYEDHYKKMMEIK